MFTLKQVLLNGETNFYEATQVRLGRGPNGPQNFDERTLFFDHPPTNGVAEIGTIREGTVYVMNAHGKTIDRYTLGDPTVKPTQTIKEFIERLDREDQIVPHSEQPAKPTMSPRMRDGEITPALRDLMWSLPQNGQGLGDFLVGDPGDENDAKPRDSRPDLSEGGTSFSKARPLSQVRFRVPGSSADVVDPRLIPLSTCETGVRVGSVYLSDAEAEAAANFGRVGPLG